MLCTPFSAVATRGVPKSFRYCRCARFSSRRRAQCVRPNESLMPIRLGTFARKHSWLYGKMIETLSPTAIRQDESVRKFGKQRGNERASFRDGALAYDFARPVVRSLQL